MKLNSIQDLVSGKVLAGLCRSAFLLFSVQLFGLLLSSSNVYAQLSVDSLGTDTSQNEAYKCVRYIDASQNTVSITNENNEESFLSIDQADARVKKSLKRSATRQKRLKKKLQGLKDELKSVKTRLLPRPGEGKKIKNLKKAIDRAKRAVATVKGQQRNLVELRKQVATCSDDAPLVGGIVIKTVTYPSFLFSGEYTSYAIGVFYNVTRPVEIGESYCLKLDNFPTVKKYPVVIDPCPAKDSDNRCVAQFSGVSGFSLGGVLGTDDKRACAPGDDPFECDLGKGQAEAARVAAEFGNPVVLGKADGFKGCDRFE